MDAVESVSARPVRARRALLRLVTAGAVLAVAATALTAAAGGAAASTGPAPAPVSSPVTHPDQDTMGSGIRAHEGAAMAASSKQYATSRTQAFATVSSDLVLGHDVSNWQPNINWPATAAAGAKFVYIKATEGTNFRNPIFASQYIGSYYAGIIRGAYVFALPDRSSGAAQANFFVDNGGGWSPDGKTMPPMLDLEYNPYGPTCYGLTPAQMVAWVRDFSNTVKARTGIYPVIYTSANYWNMCTASNPTFGSTNPLFIAYYPYVRSPLGSPGPMPAGWAYQSIWQYSDSGTFPGDADVWNGSLAQLQRFVGPTAGGTATTTPVTTTPVTTTPVTTTPVTAPPVTVTTDPVDAYYVKLGGAGYLGGPTGAEYAVAGGKARDYTNGSIYWSPSTGAHMVHGAIRLRYRALGGPAGILGFPISDQLPAPDRVGQYNTFSGMGRSSIYWSPASGAHAVGGAIRSKWRDLGGPAGLVGYPLTDELPTAGGGGRYNSFTGADIFWSRSTGAHEVHGAIRQHYRDLGGPAGIVGLPLTDEQPTTAGGGRYNSFTGADIYWSPGTGTHEVHGAIRGLYNAMGGAKSPLGLPLTDEYSAPGGRRSDFQRGFVFWNATTRQTTPNVG